MAFNGSGTFVRLFNWATDKTNSVAVTASRMDSEHDGFATGLTAAICKDGQSTTTGVIPFAAGVKLSDGSLSTPALNFINDTDTGIYRTAANTLSFVVAGAKVLEIGTATVSCGVALTFTGTLGVASGGTGITTTNSSRVKRGTNQSINDNTNTDVSFDTEDHDTNGLFATASATQLTAVVAGTYVISGCVRFASDATPSGNRVASIKKNGATYLGIAGRAPHSSDTGTISINVTAVAQLAANDYVTLEVFQDSGAALNVLTVAGLSPIFAMARISA